MFFDDGSKQLYRETVAHRHTETLEEASKVMRDLMKDLLGSVGTVSEPLK